MSLVDRTCCRWILRSRHPDTARAPRLSNPRSLRLLAWRLRPESPPPSRPCGWERSETSHSHRSARRTPAGRTELLATAGSSSAARGEAVLATDLVRESPVEQESRAPPALCPLSTPGQPLGRFHSLR